MQNPTVESMIAKLDADRAANQAKFGELDPNALVYADGPWTVTNIISHLTIWEEEFLKGLQAHQAGQSYLTEMPDLEGEDAGLNAFNARTVGERKQLSYEQALAQWASVRQQIKTTLASLTPEQIAAPMVAPWGGDAASPVAQTGGCLWHEGHHLKETLDAVNADSTQVG
ncbi:DinB family protein [Herpetosiphon llansteffanensis]